jgi:hypothetical protein
MMGLLSCVVHILDPKSDGAWTENWIVGEQVTREDYEKFKDREGNLYVVIWYEAGKPNSTLAPRSLWEQAAQQFSENEREGSKWIERGRQKLEELDKAQKMAYIARVARATRKISEAAIAAGKTGGLFSKKKIDVDLIVDALLTVLVTLTKDHPDQEASRLLHARLDHVFEHWRELEAAEAKLGRTQ